ncbi:MAG: MarR family transcriptional regulator [Pseudozobellia sp.]|nr:MarR family transcriptional regulator [Pseudozobellia sp.]MBG47805.1 MarR family transcriptional regulator [Pseudozobellia sp.]|tara:strand:+ start:534 stop:1493 length:960 start_codon:yes stop_codon:yes gene_type:complete
MNLFERTGKIALGSRLRLLSSRMTDDATKIYRMYELELSPNWFPVLFILSQDGAKTITEIAEEIGHSQPSVTKIVKEMTKSALIAKHPYAQDKRRNMVALTEKGMAAAQHIIDVQCKDVDAAVDALLAQANHNLWEALAEWEFLLDQKSLFHRVNEQRKLRESQKVKIVEYSPEYKEAFKNLNEEWISKYFIMEKEDYKALDHPQEYILEPGGKIMVALYDNEPVGVCALIKMKDPEYDFELAKMGVSPKAQGKSIGYLLGKSVLEEAKKLGAKKLYLESNTVLKPAISLYQKLGFQKVAHRPTPYSRSNIQMALVIKD